jgi:hypothetical protein
MAAPRKKPPVKKPPVKKAPVKKPPKIVFREVAPEPKKKIVFKTTKDDSPKKSQSAKDVKSGGLRVQHLQEAKNEYNTARNNKLLELENRNKEARRRNKITKFRIQSLTSKADDLKKSIAKYENMLSRTPKTTSSAGSKALALLKGVAKGSGILGAITSPITSAVPAGAGSTVPGQAQKAVEKKMKREIRQGPKLAVTGVKEGVIGKTRSLRNKTGQNRPEYPTWKNKPKASESSSSSTYSGYGTSNIPKKIRNPYSGYGTSNVPKKEKSEASGAAQNRPTTTRPKPLNTLAADYAAKQQGQNQGQAKAKNAAPKPTPKPRPVASSAPVKKVGRLSRTEREGLSTDRMQRKPKGNLLGFLKKRK